MTVTRHRTCALAMILVSVLMLQAVIAPGGDVNQGDTPAAGAGEGAGELTGGGTRGDAGIVINEIMYDPFGADTNHEWLELFNKGGAGVDLTGWKFWEAGTNHGLTLVQGSWNIPPVGYAVIVQDGTTFLADRPSYSGTVLDSTFSLVNSGGERLAMRNGTGSPVADEVQYAPAWGGGGNGMSLECIGPWGDNNASANWGSTTIFNGTPGAQNSIYGGMDPAPRIKAVSHEPKSPGAGMLVNVTALVTDNHQVAHVNLTYRVDSGSWQTVPMHDDGSTAGDPVASDDNYTAQIQGQAAMAVVSYNVSAADNASGTAKDPADAPASLYRYQVGVGTGDHMTINELMPDPGVVDWNGNGLTGDADDEYVELYNPTGSWFDLSGFTLKDDDGQMMGLWGELGPGEFATWSRGKEGLPLALANTGDEVELMEGAASVDRVEYGDPGADDTALSDAVAPGSDASLSLFPDGDDNDDPLNDYTAVLPPTPNASNGELGNYAVAISNLTLAPPHPGPGEAQNVTVTCRDGKAVEAVALSYRTDGGSWSHIPMGRKDGNTTSGNYTAEVPGQSDGTFVEYYIDARDDVHCSYLPATAPALPYNYTVSATALPDVVVNEVLYDPAGTEADEEFIELYNNGTTAVDLGGFWLDDADGASPDVVLPSISMPAGGFLVLLNGAGTNDTAFTGGAATLYLHRTSTWHTNTGDDVTLYNPLGWGVDYAAWGHSPTSSDPPPPDLSWEGPNASASEGQSVARVFDGYDTDRGSDWAATEPTPGIGNGEITTGRPVLVALEREPGNPRPGQQINFTLEAVDDKLVAAAYLNVSIDGGAFASHQMADAGAGAHPGSTAFTWTLAPQTNGTQVTYRAAAVDDDGQWNVTSDHLLTVSDVSPPIFINEWLPNTGDTDYDGDGDVSDTSDEWIELYNAGGSAFDLGGWRLDDLPGSGTGNGSSPWEIPAGTVINASGYRVFYSSETRIALNNDGDNVTLWDGDWNMVDIVGYNSSGDDTSWGRTPDGGDDTVEFEPPTPGRSNGAIGPPTPATPAERRMLISDVFYNAAGDEEFFRVFNNGSDVVNISGWYVTDGEGFVYFPAGTELPPLSGLYVANDAGLFLDNMGFFADMELSGTDPALPQMDRYKSWPTMNNAGDECILMSGAGEVIDAVVYGDSDYKGAGWSGEPVAKVGTDELLFRNPCGPGYADTNASADFESVLIKVLGQSSFTLQEFAFTGEVIPFASPETSYDVIAAELDAASSIIKLNLYQLDSWPLAERLIDAMDRGVEVKLFLEGGPVGGISDKEKYVVRELAAAGAHVRFMITNATLGIGDRYRYDHAKYCLIDGGTTMVMSENWKKTGVPANNTYGNRGWGVVVRHAGLTAYMDAVFESDFDPGRPDSFAYEAQDMRYGDPPGDFEFDFDIPGGWYDPLFEESPVITGDFTVTPVISPDTSVLEGEGILGMLGSAEESICVEQLICDLEWDKGDVHYENMYLEACIDAARRGVDVRVVLDSAFVNPYDKETMDNFDTVTELNTLAHRENISLQARLIDLRATRLDKVHVKGVIVDDHMSLVSSINWGRSAAIYNREVGLIIDNTDVAAFYQRLFDIDWDNSTEDGEPVNGTEDPDGDDGGGDGGTGDGGEDPPDDEQPDLVGEGGDEKEPESSLWIGVGAVMIVLVVIVLIGIFILVPRHRERKGAGKGEDDHEGETVKKEEGKKEEGKKEEGKKEEGKKEEGKKEKTKEGGTMEEEKKEQDGKEEKGGPPIAKAPFVPPSPGATAPSAGAGWVPPPPAAPVRPMGEKATVTGESAK